MESVWSMEKHFCQSQGSATFFDKRAILLHSPPDMTGDETQNVDTVLFFIRLHMDVATLH